MDDVYSPSTSDLYKQLIILQVLFDYLDKSCSTFPLIS